MNYITYSILICALVCLAGSRATAQDAEDDLVASPSPSSSTTTTTSTTTQAPPPKKKAKAIVGDAPKKAPVCPDRCKCTDKPKRLICLADDKKMTPPPFSTYEFNGLVSIDIRGFVMPNLDLNAFSAAKDSLEHLSLSECEIKTVSGPQPANKKEPTAFNKLKSLTLSDNSLQSIGKLSNWKFPALETLDLSSNPLVEIGQNDLNNTKSLQNLNLQNLNLKSIHEQSFQNLTALKALNMTGTKIQNHLGDKQFAANQLLETIDLTDNGLIEVPFALRSTDSVIRLILNANLMTSLRQSDFINRTKLVELEVRGCPRLSKIDDLTFSDLAALKRLYITDNPTLGSISRDAFKTTPPASNHTLDVFDIRNNNLSTLANPLEFSSLTFKQLLLSGNPWHCDCGIRWFQQFPAQSHPLAHCKSPAQYADIEIGEFLTTIDCEVYSSIMSTVVVTGFFLFLLILLVLVIVQKSDICRRFLWRDQYGTIYYTKASFPPETV